MMFTTIAYGEGLRSVNEINKASDAADGATRLYFVKTKFGGECAGGTRSFRRTRRGGFNASLQ
jgi:hypothetical protein